MRPGKRRDRPGHTCATCPHSYPFHRPPWPAVTVRVRDCSGYPLMKADIPQGCQPWLVSGPTRVLYELDPHEALREEAVVNRAAKASGAATKLRKV
jgi:hypothetical protein